MTYIHYESLHPDIGGPLKDIPRRLLTSKHDDLTLPVPRKGLQYETQAKRHKQSKKHKLEVAPPGSGRQFSESGEGKPHTLYEIAQLLARPLCNATRSVRHAAGRCGGRAELPASDRDPDTGGAGNDEEVQAGTRAKGGVGVVNAGDVPWSLSISRTFMMSLSIASAHSSLSCAGRAVAQAWVSRRSSSSISLIPREHQRTGKRSWRAYMRTF